MASNPVAHVFKQVDVSETLFAAHDLRIAKLEATVAELREELEILASRLGYQEQRGKR